MPLTLTNFDTLSAMIAPALFLTASGSLIISTSNRLARIADRVRVLCNTLDQLSRDPGTLDFVEDRLELTQELLNRMAKRNEHIRFALTYLYFALASFAATSLSLAVNVWLGDRISLVPTALAVLGVVLLVAACARLSGEALLTLRGEDREIQFYRDLLSKRRKAIPDPSPDITL